MPSLPFWLYHGKGICQKANAQNTKQLSLLRHLHLPVTGNKAGDPYIMTATKLVTCPSWQPQSWWPVHHDSHKAGDLATVTVRKWPLPLFARALQPPTCVRQSWWPVRCDLTPLGQHGQHGEYSRTQSWESHSWPHDTPAKIPHCFNILYSLFQRACT